MKGPGALAALGAVPEASSALPAELIEGATLDWEAVYRAHAADVARWAARLAGPAEDVDDLVHEVFLVVQGRLGGWRGEAKLSTWLYRITVNVVRHQRRKNRLRRWLGLVPPEEPVATGPAPDEHAAARQALATVYRALEALSERERRVMILHELEGLTGPEIAALEGVTPSAVWVRLHRARKRFAARVAALEAGR